MIPTPLSNFKNEVVFAIAAGSVRIQEKESKTKGNIAFGVEVKQDFSNEVIYNIGRTKKEKPGFYLLLDPSHAGPAHGGHCGRIGE